MSAANAAPLTGRLVGLVRLLRANGFALGLREAEDASRAVAGSLLQPDALREGLRTLLYACERAGGASTSCTMSIGSATAGTRPGFPPAAPARRIAQDR